MKKLILFAWFTCLAICSFSQTVGFRAGATLSNQMWKITGEKMQSAYKPGGLGTFTVNVGQTEIASAQFELSYASMGFGSTNIGDSIQVDSQILKYVKIGCAVKYHVFKSSNIHFGPELGFQFEKVKDLQYLANPDFGVFLGAEHYFTEYLGIGTRFYIGLSDINESGDIKQFNRSFQLYLTFRLPSKQLKEMGY